MLLSGGQRVRILVRERSAYSALAAAGAQPARGDLKDARSLEAACSGVATVVTTANSALRDAPDTAESVDLAGNASLIDAARAAGVAQFIFVSALGADAASRVPFIAAKGATEDRLAASGMAYTILAPAPFMDAWVAAYVGVPAMRGETVVIAGDGIRRHSFIASHDVAAFACASIGNPAALNRKLALGGPEPVTLRDVVAAFERALGRPVSTRHVRPGDAIPTLPAAMWGLAAFLDAYDSPVDMTKTAAALRVPQTSLDDFVRGCVARAGR
jgi:NADH dehydrogenase